MKKGLRVFMVFLVIGLFFSCTKEEGFGGKGTIKGKIYVKDFNQDGVLKSEYYGANWTVYIVFGEDDFYGDKVDTHYDGTYKFEYLYPGNYTIYTYSKCLSCAGEFETLKQEVIISGEDVLVLDDIVANN